MTATRVVYISSSVALADHWKVHELAHHAGCSYLEAIGILHHLWWFTANASEDAQLTGDLSRFPARVIEQACRGELLDVRERFANSSHTVREPFAVVRALFAAGWLDGEIDGEKHVHDWRDHAARGIERMTKARDRMRERRDGTRATATDAPDYGAESADVREPFANSSHTVRTRSRTVRANKDSNSDKLGTTATRSAQSAPVAPTAVGEPLRHAPSAHPGVGIVREVLGVNPSGTVRDAIAAAVPADATDAQLATLREACAQWRLRGFNPRNVAGVLDWYREGIPAGGAPVRAGVGGAPRRESPAEQMRTITAAFEEAERANGTHDPGRRGFAELLAERLPPTRRPRDGSGRVITGVLVGGGTPRLVDGGGAF